MKVHVAKFDCWTYSPRIAKLSFFNTLAYVKIVSRYYYACHKNFFIHEHMVALVNKVFVPFDG